MRNYDELAYELQERASCLSHDSQLWIGIAGAPGSGKSTLAAALQERLKKLLLVIPMDGYHFFRRELDEMDNPEEAHIRRGSPFTFNSTKFTNDLIEARNSGEGYFPSFDHRIADPIDNDIQLSKSKQIVLVEGNYLLLDTEPWSLLRKAVFDETWYLDVSIQECKRRLMTRHVKVGLSEAQALKRINTNDGINAELILKQSPANADRIVRIT